jgi:hypothetical protein
LQDLYAVPHRYTFVLLLTTDYEPGNHPIRNHEFFDSNRGRAFAFDSIMMRQSRRASKQLLWMWVEELMRESQGFKSGLDIACGYMKNKPMFKTENYFGLDADEERIETGQATTGGRGIVCKIEDIPPDIKGDFVVCLETIGINTRFDEGNAVIAYEKCVHATNRGGSLLVNVGPRARDYFGAIEKIASDSFVEVEIREYGRASEKRHRTIANLLSKLYLLFPFLAKSKTTPHLLIYCKNRRDGN